MDVVTYALLKKQLGSKADLINGKIPAEQLPSYVDDVIEYESLNDFPETGEGSKIYVALDTGFTYRWSGSDYIQIGGQDLSDYYTKEETDAELETKQDVIEDLTDIRDGAEAGATAVQPEDALTDEEIALAWIIWPEKGQRIGINVDGTGEKPFIVLSRNGTIAKVLCQYSFPLSWHETASSTWERITSSKSVYWSNEWRTAEQQKTAVYSNGSEYLADSYVIKSVLTQYYNTFTPTIKNAIQNTSRTLNVWTSTITNSSKTIGFEWNNEKLQKVDAFLDCGEKKLFLLTLDELWEYFNLSIGEILPTSRKSEYQKLWDKELTSNSNGIVSASVSDQAGKGFCLCYVLHWSMALSTHNSNQRRNCIYYAMNIDLSQIDYTILPEE